MVPVRDFGLLNLSIDLRWQPVDYARHLRVQSGPMELLGHFSRCPGLLQHLLPAIHENLGNRSKVPNDLSDPPLFDEIVLLPENIHETELHCNHDNAGYERS